MVSYIHYFILNDLFLNLKINSIEEKHGVGVCCPSSYRGEEKPKPSTSKPSTSKPSTSKPATSKPTPKPSPRPNSTPKPTPKPVTSRKSLIEEAKSGNYLLFINYLN